MANTDAQSQIAALRQDIEKLRDAVATQGADALDQARGRAGQAARSVGSAVTTGRRYVRSEGAAVAEVAREHPAAISTMVTLAGLAGFAAGYLLATATDEAPRRRSWY
ncbi:hypothetical protein LXM94_03455 [Rhizobium sp. TRM95111]|uniref:hypothetical protein n=1 Tax=Rhizobium alarense TaxID=2846851 RepID=UPI001F2C16BD|nr:hypothetical protein [Rhizobium alarense]MCF3639020.1 hypothetical protein [Rhizobium alarense]